jgi:fucose 4-O-acetylase-like acetyltransferase
MNNRIEYIDIAKALGILLVILGHCHFTYNIPRLGIAIYSFHMPLFFFISGMFIKPLDFNTSLRKYSKAYLKSYGVTCILMFLLTLILVSLHQIETCQLSILFERIAFGNGSNEGDALFHDVPTVGPIWFLLALFWGCLISAAIKNISCSSMNMFILAFVCFVVGYLSAQHIRLPLSFQMGLCSVPFLLSGGLIRQYKIIDQYGESPKFVLALVFIIWLFVVITMGNGLNMASCRYDEGIVRIPISFFATITCLYLCKNIIPPSVKLLKVLGQNTLYVLAGHQLLIFYTKIVDFNFEYISIVPSPLTIFVEFLLQVAIAIAIGKGIKKLHLF